MGTFSAIETFIDIFIRLSLFITHAQYLGRYLFLNFTSSHSFSFIISHTLSLSLSLTIKQTLWSLYLSFLIGTHQKCSIYSLQWYNLFSFSTNTLHSHSIFRSLSWYIPCMHSTLIGLFPISHFCASLSFPYTLPCSHLHSYLFLVSIFLPSSQPVPLPPSHHLSPCFCQCQRNKNLKLHLVNILFSEKPSLYCPQERHYIFPSHFSSLFPQRRYQPSNPPIETEFDVIILF